MSDDASLSIVHVARAPVGGIFRHILDLARGQVARGHRVGLIIDSRTGGARAEGALASIAPELALGVSRIAMGRELAPSDVFGLYRVSRCVRKLDVDVVHGHGAKGGAFARLSSAGRPIIRAYTPHGGSLHYGPRTLRGLLYASLERVLMRRTDLLLFESFFARDTYQAIVGMAPAIAHVVHNGVGRAEFDGITPAHDATDIVYVGELRRLKGPDLLIDALAHLCQSGRPVSATIVGEGDASDALRAQIAQLGLLDLVRFVGHVRARLAFSLGRLLVVPSRGESLPYVVIEAAAAGVPMLATRVGGIPEIFGPQACRLVPPEDPVALAKAIAAVLDKPAAARADADALRERVRAAFSQNSMVEGVLAAYREAIAAKLCAKPLTVF
jgi:glycosyltransferase involved in cell wall biosynthesis